MAKAGRCHFAERDDEKSNGPGRDPGSCKENGVGTVAFSPLAQGLLTNKYIKGIPSDSRIAKHSLYLHETDVTEEKIDKVIKLNKIAEERGQTLAQMALAWNLREDLTSVIIGASSVKQIEDNVKTIENLKFSKEELDKIEEILKGNIL